ncbi:MAG: cyclophane-forming radical SAM/SPASM peptide maturase GrrM/OscB [Terrimicrobiaceae bacterium]|nr:GRRM system radical SAM/SPASM domain protein [Terrimicrobiaceae bacterium]
MEPDPPVDAHPPGSMAHGEWLTLAVIQPSPFCNINCDYCYLPSRSEIHRMSERTLRSVVSGIFATDLVRDSLTFVWHAGEPTAVPISWYRKAFELILEEAPEGLKIIHSFQTNGTLINDDWCRFIKETGICLGLSIDGPAPIHDAHRKTRQGKGTHEWAMRGVELLRSHQIDFHVIAVVTQDSLDHADEIFDFFVNQGIVRFGFNIEEQEGIHTKSSLDSGSDDKVTAFFRTMFERQKATGGAVRIREFDFALQRILCRRESAEFVYENEQVRPFGILSVDWQGNFATFSPEMLGLPTAEYGTFSFGSFLDGGLESALANKNFLSVLGDTKAGVERCRRECAFFNLCGGGAPANKYFENGAFGSTETAYCRHVIQLPISLVLEDLEKSLPVDVNG